MRFIALTGRALVIGTACSATHAEVLHDNLCITDSVLYDSSWWSFCGGREYWGASYNAESADVFRLATVSWVTSATMDYQSLYGLKPEAICIRIYQGISFDCDSTRPEEASTWSQSVESANFSWIILNDSPDGAPMRRATMQLDDPIRIPSGCAFLSMQAYSETDVYGVPLGNYRYADDYPCMTVGNPWARSGAEDDPCCEGKPFFFLGPDWDYFGSLEPDTFSMRIEGIPAGECVGGERMRTKCTPMGAGDEFKVVVRVAVGQPNSVVTALLDPPDPRSVSIALDVTGKGKGKFKHAAEGDHKVFLCNAIETVTCHRR